MLAQFLDVVLWTALEYLLLRAFLAVAPHTFARFLVAIFPTPKP